MDTLHFVDVDTNEEVELYIVEETVISGQKYILVAEDDSDEADAYIFKEITDNDTEITYEPVEDDEEYTAIAAVFEQLLDEDTELRR